MGIEPVHATEHWVPPTALGGTEILVAGLRERLGAELDRINLQVNLPDPKTFSDGPLVVWFHHDVNQPAVQWCQDARCAQVVSRFVFVSHWQMTRYIAKFKLPPESCLVLKNATEVSPTIRHWQPSPVWRCAYVSTPYRGLSVLLKAWEQLSHASAELHVWSSMKLYRMDAADEKYRALYDRARRLRGVVYHGLAPNEEVRAALRGMHFLAYPNTWEETSCLSAIEAMAAGCRVVVPHRGALPETTAGYARLYPWLADEDAHAALFAKVLAAELADPWEGEQELAVAQQAHCAAVHGWEGRIRGWKRLIDAVAA